jgi:hypothetical protein
MKNCQHKNVKTVVIESVVTMEKTAQYCNDCKVFIEKPKTEI